jgi:hypothetical protein
MSYTDREIIICTDQAEFDSINTKIYDAIKASRNVTTWDEALVHPTTGQIAITVEDDIKSHLSSSELARITNIDSTWFS